MTHSVLELAKLLRSKMYVIAFTGAGISTDSGIPDFRSEGGGLWNRINPEFLSARTLRTNPALFYKYFRQIDSAIRGKQPNPGHLAIAELSRLGIVRSVITQNIDGLHQKAGSKRVFEVHGNLKTCVCTRCRRVYPYEVLRAALSHGGDIPVSPCCSQCLRPGVVLFGDKMAPDFLEAREEAFRAHFALVIGTSLTVYPAAEIPLAVGDFAIINRENTAMDDRAAIRVEGDISAVLTELVDILKTIPSI